MVQMPDLWDLIGAGCMVLAHLSSDEITGFESHQEDSKGLRLIPEGTEPGLIPRLYSILPQDGAGGAGARPI